MNSLMLVLAYWPVLIVPLWNWNEEEDFPDEPTQGFNRTFMELKWRKASSISLILSSFNRTFMELKSHRGSDASAYAEF